MVPGTDLQLQVVLKALREVVAPAVDPANRLAAEQLHLSIATLELVRGHLPLEHQRSRQELRNALGLANAVRSAGGSGSLASVIEAVQALLNDANAADADLDKARLALLAETEAAVAESKGTASRKAIARAVVDGTRAQLDLARAWCLPAGFEPNASELPGLDKLL